MNLQYTIAITLPETSRANKITVNEEMFLFISKDCKFFGRNLTSEGYKFDHQEDINYQIKEATLESSRASEVPRLS